jgi:hypothetical protein
MKFPLSKSRKITILLSSYLGECFFEIFESLGFNVLWEGQQKREDIINHHCIDLAIEWQHGERDFPVRDFLKKYHHDETEIFLALNLNGRIPDDFDLLGFSGFLEVPFVVDEMMDKFEKSLSNKKTKFSKFQQERMSDMNKKQKILVSLVIIVLIVMLTFPPFHFIYRGCEFNLGYDFIMNPPRYQDYDDFLGSINVKLLILQYLFVCTIGIGIFFLLKNIKRKNEIYDLNSGKLESDKSKLHSKKGGEFETGKNTNNQQTEIVVDIKESKPKKIWLYLVGVSVLGAYAGMFIRAYAGENIDPSSGYSSMFFTGLFFYIWWKRRDCKGWQGGLIGTLIGIIVFTLASFVEGLM